MLACRLLRRQSSNEPRDLSHATELLGIGENRGVPDKVPSVQVGEEWAYREKARTRAVGVESNAFGGPSEKQRAQSILGELSKSGGLDRDFLLGAVLAAGVSVRGITNLAKIIDRSLRV